MTEQNDTVLKETGPGVKPRLLIVDDHPDQRKLFKLIAENLEISAVIVASCEEAMLAIQDEKFDLILMDWQMPEIDGLACAAMIRKKERDVGERVPIIAVTAHALPGDRERCLNAGMDDYLGKPFSISELKQMIARWARSRSVGAISEAELRL